MKHYLYCIGWCLLFVPLSQYGAQEYALPFSLLPVLPSDPTTLFVVAGEPPLGGEACWYGISTLTEKTTRFFPALTDIAMVNGQKKENPLWQKAFDYAAIIHTFHPFGHHYFLSVIPRDSLTLYVLIKPFSYVVRNTVLLEYTPTLLPGVLPQRIRGMYSVRDGVVLLIESNVGTMFIVGVVVEENVQKGPQGYNSYFRLNEVFCDEYTDKNPFFSLGENDEVTLITPTPVVVGSDDIVIPLLLSSGKGSTGFRGYTLFTGPGISETACGAKSIIATTGAGSIVQSTSGALLATSSGLRYLVVQGGVYDDPLESTRHVYALPLVNDVRSPAFLHVAAVNQEPEMIFFSAAPSRYEKTIVSQEAMTPEEVYSQDTPVAQVGGGSFFSALSLDEVRAYGDAVVVRAHAQTPESTGGLFFSQGLLNEKGMIGGWTPWQRKGIVGNLLSYSYLSGSYAAIMQDDPKGVQQLQWGGRNNALYSYFFTLLVNNTPLKKGGVQGIVDIPSSYECIKKDSNGYGPSYALFLGNGTVAMVQTALTPLMPLTPKNVVRSFDGSLENMRSMVDAIIMTGGVLEEAGALITGDIVYSGNEGWFVVGGSGGVFVLAGENGAGISGPLEGYFGNMTSSLRWKRLGTGTMVKKIIAADSFIFVVTNTEVFRIPMTVSQVQLGKQCHETVIATAGSFDSRPYASFADGIFSGGVALLATSGGLAISTDDVRIGEGRALWRIIDLPEQGAMAPIQLLAISRSGKQSSWASDSDAASHGMVAGNVYVVCASIGMHGGSLYRFATYDSQQGVQNAVRIMPNYFIGGIPSYYCNFFNEIFSLMGDGATWIGNMVSSMGELWKGGIVLLPQGLRNGLYDNNDVVTAYSTAAYNVPIEKIAFISGWGVFAAGTGEGVCGLW